MKLSYSFATTTIAVSLLSTTEGLQDNNLRSVVPSISTDASSSSTADVDDVQKHTIRDTIQSAAATAVTKDIQRYALTPTTNDGYYPSWNTGEKICKNDGNAPDYMTDRGYHENTQKECCERYYSFDIATCMGSNLNVADIEGFYPVWNDGSGEYEIKCRSTCDTLPPKYMLNDPPFWIDADIETCCSRQYWWAKDSCISASRESAGCTPTPTSSSSTTAPTDMSLSYSERMSYRPVRNKRRLTESTQKQSVPPHMSKRAGLDIMPFFCGMGEWGDNIQDQAISIATQTDWGTQRLIRLVQMAKRWDGYISVVIYGKEADEDQLLSQVEALWTKHEQSFNGKVAIHVVIDRRPKDDLYYPHNILRNIAMENTPTDLLFYNDIDFIPSYKAHSMLLKHIPSMPNDEPSVMVLPAFERKLQGNEDETKISLKDIPSNKASLMGNLITNDRIRPFRESYQPGHGPSNYTKWYTATKAYQINFALNYEPYFVVSKRWNLPPFWEHFTGYGKNKQTWVEEIGVAGFNFFVCPEAFITHVDHNNDKQDDRTVRSTMIDEYGINFQQYLVQTYGRKLWGDEDLTKWVEMNKRNYILKDIHMCKAAELEFSDKSHFDMKYQCEGGKYKKFGRLLRDYIVANITEPMGRRPFPIPSNSTVLIMGNSHTRQMAETLLCQYADSVESFETKSIGTGKTDFFVAHLHNNATLISLTNNPIVYSKDWKKLLQNVINRRLSSLDAIILGKFNTYSESKGTNFLKTIDDIASNLNITIDFENVAPPSLKDVAKVYKGPIVSVSMFGVQGIPEERLSNTTQKSLLKYRSRDNIRVISGRKYIDELGMECGTDLYSGEGGDCTEMKKKNKKDDDSRLANHMHRCMGALGGHPDLIAWEAVEAIYSSCK